MRYKNCAFCLLNALLLFVVCGLGMSEQVQAGTAGEAASSSARVETKSDTASSSARVETKSDTASTPGITETLSETSGRPTNRENLSQDPSFQLFHDREGKGTEGLQVLLLPGVGFNVRLFDLEPEVSLVRYLGARDFGVWTLLPDWTRGKGASEESRPQVGTGRSQLGSPTRNRESLIESQTGSRNSVLGSPTRNRESLIESQTGSRNSVLGSVVSGDLASALETIQSVRPEARVILLGFGTGATLVAAYLEHGPSPHVAGAVLVAPILALRSPDRVYRKLSGIDVDARGVENPLEWLSRDSGFAGGQSYYCLLLSALPVPECDQMRQQVASVLTPVEGGTVAELQGLISKDCCPVGAWNVFRDLPRVTAPVLVLSGIADNIAHPEDVAHAVTHIGSSDREYQMFSRTNLHHMDYGHLDLLLSPSSRKDVYPRIVRWLDGKRTGQPIPPSDRCLGAD